MRFGLASALLATMLAVSAPASADVIYTLSGVTLAGGGTLTGSFAVNNALNSVTSANIVASAQGAFGGFSYVYPSAVLSQSLPTQYFQLDASGRQLRIYFNNPGLTATGASINLGHSYDYDPHAGNRLITGGSLVVGAIPEPASLTILGIGLVLGAAALSRRQRA